MTQSTIGPAGPGGAAAPGSPADSASGPARAQTGRSCPWVAVALQRHRIRQTILKIREILNYASGSGFAMARQWTSGPGSLRTGSAAAGHRGSAGPKNAKPPLTPTCWGDWPSPGSRTCIRGEFRWPRPSGSIRRRWRREWTGRASSTSARDTAACERAGNRTSPGIDRPIVSAGTNC